MITENVDSASASSEYSGGSTTVAKDDASVEKSDIVTLPGSSSSNSVILTNTVRRSIDAKYAIAMDASRFTAYQQLILKKESVSPTVAFFGIKLKSFDIDREILPVFFQHGDQFKNHIFLIAVTSDESHCSGDIFSVFVNKDWFLKLFDRLINGGKTISSTPMFPKCNAHHARQLKYYYYVKYCISR
jgi:hypothetical protein